MRSVGSPRATISRMRAFASVVFPEAVPPAMRMFRRSRERRWLRVRSGPIPLLPGLTVEDADRGHKPLELQRAVAVLLGRVDGHQLHRTQAGKISKASRPGSSAFRR
jgi:hypothetical protein